MSLILRKIDESSLQKEHLAWFDFYIKQMPDSLKTFKADLEAFLQTLDNEQFSILSYPTLWSEKHFFETSIQLDRKVRQHAAYRQINQWLKKQKKNVTNDKNKLKEIDKLANSYEKYFTVLKRKVLARAIKECLANLEDSVKSLPAGSRLAEAIFAFKREINQLLSQQTLLNMQTRYDCLHSHLQITLACQQTIAHLATLYPPENFPSRFSKTMQYLLTPFRWLTTRLELTTKTLAASNIDIHIKRLTGTTNNLKSASEKKKVRLNKEKKADEIQLIEILAKCLIDSYYQKAKKMTFTDAIQKDIATLASSVGFVIGLVAFSVGIASIFLPHLAIPLLVLGTIGFISYLASALSVIKIAEEGLKYKRQPSFSAILWLTVDIVLFPLNFIAGNIIALFGKSFRWATTTIKMITKAWDDVLSNILPDIFSAKETIKETFAVGATYTKTGQLKNTTATSWDLIGSTLAVTELNQKDSAKKIFTKINNTKKHLAQRTSNRPASFIETLYNRGFAYTSLQANQSNNKEEVLPTLVSHHADILFWLQGFRGFRISDEAQAINITFAKYKNLPADSTKRVNLLNELKDKCNNYLSKYNNEVNKQKKGRYRHVEKLFNLVQEEITNLTASSLETPILVGYKLK